MSESCEEEEQGGLSKEGHGSLKPGKEGQQHTHCAELLEPIYYCCSTTGSPKLLTRPSFQTEEQRERSIGGTPRPKCFTSKYVF